MRKTKLKMFLKFNKDLRELLEKSEGNAHKVNELTRKYFSIMHKERADNADSNC